MNRVINIAKICRVFSFVDDYMGAGSKNDALATQELTHTVIRGVVGYEGLSVKRMYSPKERRSWESKSTVLRER